MKKFLARLIGLSAIIIVIIVGLHIVAIYNLRDEVEEAYTLDPTKDVLFLGSSETGCAIDTSPRFHNKVMWFSMTTMQSALIRLRELEERGQLSKVNLLFMPFYVRTMGNQTLECLNGAYWKEFYVSWKNFDVYHQPLLSMIVYRMCRLRFPMEFAINEGVPDSPSISSRSDEWRWEYLKKASDYASNIKIDETLVEGWQQSLRATLLEVKEICYRNGIRFILFKSPMMSQCYAYVPQRTVKEFEKWVEWIKLNEIEYIDDFFDGTDDDYRDWVHLSDSGRERFTTLLFSKSKIPIR